MEVRAAIYNRRSIRAYTSEPVSKKKLVQLLDAAIQAPSARNLQPWQFVVVTGSARARLAARLTAAYEADLAQGGQMPTMTLPEPYQTRISRFLAALQPFGDQQPDFDLIRGSLNFYGAPAVLLAALDRSLPPDRLFDLGAAVQNLLLLAQAQGLGTCVIGIALRYKDLIREELQLPEHLNLAMTVAVGVPDPASPLSAFKPGRADLADVLTWIE